MNRQVTAALISGCFVALGLVAGAARSATQAGVIAIAGAASNESVGDTVAGLGDVNGDGRPDVVLDGDGDGNGTGDIAYVVFGRPSPADIDLAALGSQGFRIRAVPPFNGGSIDTFSVGRAGDMNGDGLADVVLSEAISDNNGRSASGSAWVVFGGMSPTDVDVKTLGSRGFRIDGGASDDLAGVSVTAVGDVNGDGREDLAVASKPCCSGEKAEAVYLVYGRPSPTNVDLGALGSRGFRIDGVENDYGIPVAGAGDV